MDDSTVSAFCNEWSKLLGIRSHVEAEVKEGGSFCSYHDKGKFKIEVSPNAYEYDIAHELGHVRLGEEIDPCFSMFLFDPDENDESFMLPVALSGCFNDIWVDDQLFELKPELIDTYLSDSLEKLNSLFFLLTENIYELNLFICTHAMLNAEIDRWGLSAKCDKLTQPMNSLGSLLGEGIVKREAGLSHLFNNLPTLPQGRFKAVNLFQETLCNVSRILGYQGAVLLYNEIEDYHFWVKK